MYTNYLSNPWIFCRKHRLHMHLIQHNFLLFTEKKKTLEMTDTASHHPLESNAITPLVTYHFALTSYIITNN